MAALRLCLPAMSIELSDEERQRAVESLMRYAAEHFDERMGNIAASGLLGFFVDEIGPLIYNRAVAEVGPGKASLFIHLMPVFGTLLSALFLGERPQPYHALGIAMILSGIFLTSTSKPR